MSIVQGAGSPRAQTPSHLRVRDQLQDVMERLVADYREFLAVGSIVRCVARSTEVVFRDGGGASDAADRVERLARGRLESRLSGGVWPRESRTASREDPDVR